MLELLDRSLALGLRAVVHQVDLDLQLLVQSAVCQSIDRDGIDVLAGIRLFNVEEAGDGGAIDMGVAKRRMIAGFDAVAGFRGDGDDKLAADDVEVHCGVLVGEIHHGLGRVGIVLRRLDAVLGIVRGSGGEVLIRVALVVQRSGCGGLLALVAPRQDLRISGDDNIIASGLAQRRDIGVAAAVDDGDGNAARDADLAGARAGH